MNGIFNIVRFIAYSLGAVTVRKAVELAQH
jgi:hypothetical protein